MLVLSEHEKYELRQLGFGELITVYAQGTCQFDQSVEYYIRKILAGLGLRNEEHVYAEDRA